MKQMVRRCLLLCGSGSLDDDDGIDGASYLDTAYGRDSFRFLDEAYGPSLLVTYVGLVVLMIMMVKTLLIISIRLIVSSFLVTLWIW